MTRATMSFQSAVAFIAQGCINIREGLTTVEDGSAIYRAMEDLVQMVEAGRVGLTGKGKIIEAEEKKRRDEMYS